MALFARQDQQSGIGIEARGNRPLDMSNNQWYEATSVATPLRWSERVLSQCSQLLHFLGGLGG